MAQASNLVATTPPRADAGQAIVSFVRTYFWVLLLMLLTVPMTIYGVMRSLDWLEAPFPGFFVMENAVIPTISGYEWPPDHARYFHARVVAIDGSAVRSGKEVYDHVAARPAGTLFRYTLERGGERFEESLASMPFTVADYLQTYGIFFFYGIPTLLIGIIVGFLQPRMLQARVFMLHAATAGGYSISGIFLHHPDTTWLNMLCLGLECFVSATYVHLGMVFPVKMNLTGLARAWFVVPYAISAAIFAGVLYGFDLDPPNLSGLHAAYAFTSIGIFFCATRIFLAYRGQSDPDARLRVKAIIPGALVSGAAMFLIFAENASAERTLPAQFGLVAGLFFYASTAYAVGKHDLFDVDRIVRQSFVYATLSIFVVSTYALFLVIATRVVPMGIGQNYAALLTVLILAFAFDPLRQAAQFLVDKAFYRTRLDYRATIADLSRAMTTLLDPRAIVGRVTSVLGGAMHLESSALCMVDPAGQAVLWKRRGEDLVEEPVGDAATALVRVFAEFPDEFQAARIPERIADPVESAAVQSFLGEAGAAIAIALAFQGRPVGFLLLGPKLSGQEFGWDDITLLRTLADQTAIAMQNAQSYAALDDLNRHLDEQVRERTAQLRTANDELQVVNVDLNLAYDQLKGAQAQLVQSEKMASLGQLVAGVAHEINNPLAFVHGAQAQLSDYVGKFVRVISSYEQAPISDPSAAQLIADARSSARIDYLIAKAPQLLKICADGTTRVKRIVNDLLVFARADGGERAQTNVNEALDSTLRLLVSRIHQLKVEVKTDCLPTPPIRANAGQLNQVWMNILTNAIDAVEGREHPEIRVMVHPVSAPAPDANSGDVDWVEAVITDNGAGMPPEVIKRVFEPFFTTKKIGQGTGLGLSIAYSVVRAHDGTIDIVSAQGEGTTFTVRLPVN